MLPRKFQYFAPATLEDASKLLIEHEGDAKVLAGGMSLIPLMRLRLASPAYVVDINRVKGLDYIKESGDGKSLIIGPLVRHHSLESSALVRKRAPLLSETAGSIGDPQVRNLGTIGGSLAHCDPSGDLGAAILAMRGQVRTFGPAGERLISIDDFLVDTFTSALKEGELKFTLHGKKLKGSWVLIRTRGFGKSAKPSWLLVKHRDAYARAGDITLEAPRSAVSNRTLAEIARDEGGDVKRAATGDPR